MGLWLTTDSHFGVKNSSPEWLSSMIDYYRKVFIELVRKHGKKDDILIHCGDVFDNRTTLNIDVMNRVMDLFDDFSGLFKEVHIVTGNHDIYKKKRNTPNSLRPLSYMNNVHVHDEEFHCVNIEGKRVAFMPWNHSPEKEREVLSKIKYSDYLFGHTSVIGALYSGTRRVDENHGNKPEQFGDFGQVYTGHIHTSQLIKNVRFLGSPYELTRNDRNNPKSAWYLDLPTGKETSFQNKYSPMYLSLDIADVQGASVEKIKRMVGNNFIDLNVDTSKIETKELRKTLDSLYEATDNVKVVSVDKTPIVEEEDLINIKTESGDIPTVIEYISKKISSDIKNDKSREAMQKLMNTLYKKHIDSL